MDQIQYNFNNKAERKISDQYMRSASQHPAKVFPQMLQKMLYYLEKITRKNEATGKALEKELSQMTSKMLMSAPCGSL